MTDWAALEDAYGSAVPVEALLDREGSTDSVAWDELWSRLCHQGTVYSASYAALPRLAELAERWPDPSFNQPLFLATCIIASTDGPKSPAAVRVAYPKAVQVLHQLAERLALGASDDTDFVFKVQALLATESDSQWATDLAALANGEVEFACANCREQLLVSFTPSGASVSSFDDASVGSRAVDPADLSALTRAEVRAYELAVAVGRSGVANHMLRLFGTLECPRCGSRCTAPVARA